MLFLDLETQHLAAEVGGWCNVEALRLAVACTYDDDAGYRDWWELQAGDLLEELSRASHIVGYGLSQFDYRVLTAYGSTRGLEAKTFDLLHEVRSQHVRSVSLNTLAVLNLGEAKVFESGVQAVKLWKVGALEELTAYCRKDVELTRRLYEFWETQGLLWVPGGQYVVWPGQRMGSG